MTENGRLRADRRESYRQILSLLSSAGPMSAPEISDKTQLSKPTVMKVLNRYVERGLVARAGKGSSTDGGGKRPSLFRFNKDAGTVLVYHIFPDELYSALTDLETNILHVESLPLCENDGPDLFLDRARALYERHRETGLGDGKPPVGIAVGTHGVTDHVRGVVIHSPHFPRWGTDFPLRESLTRALAYNGPVFIDNQIRFQVLAEKTNGVAKGRRNIIAIEGGIGLVAGIIVKGEIKRGAHSLAGEIGHMILNPFEEERCSCGGRGCFEVMVAVKRLLRRAVECAPRFPDSPLAARAGQLRPTDMAEVFAASNEGDPLAQEVMDDAARWFSIGLTNLILAYDPDTIVIQGVFVQAGAFFLQRLKKYLDEISLVGVPRQVEILYSELGRNAGVVGASAYVLNEYLRRQAFAPERG